MSEQSESMCWNCSSVMGFMEPECPACWATNPNVNMDQAIAELTSNKIRNDPREP